LDEFRVRQSKPTILEAAVLRVARSAQEAADTPPARERSETATVVVVDLSIRRSAEHPSADAAPTVLGLEDRPVLRGGQPVTPPGVIRRPTSLLFTDLVRILGSPALEALALLVLVS